MPRTALSYPVGNDPPLRTSVSDGGILASLLSLDRRLGTAVRGPRASTARRIAPLKLATVALFGVGVAVSALSLDLVQIAWAALIGSVLVLAGSFVYARLLDVMQRVLADTKRREALESHLQHADRMAMLGMLSASVAHEVGNPLTYLLGNLELMKVKLEKQGPDETFDRAEFLANLDEAIVGATRIAHNVRDMRAMSRKDDHQTLKEVDVKK